MKIMFVCAHPDDEGRVTGLAARCVDGGGEALLVSCSNGNAGHQSMARDELARTRREEARRAGEAIGARYLVLDHADARLEATIEIREELIGLIREFHPDLLVGLRPLDYHPDHRAAGQLIVDASYLLTVPHVRPDVPVMRSMPVICQTYDRFTKPLPFHCDVAVGVDEYFDKKVASLACHESQMFEWLPYNGGYLDQVPTDAAERAEWFRGGCEGRFGRLADQFRDKLIERYGEEKGNAITYAEVFEICEYGRQPSAEEIDGLFPM